MKLFQGSIREKLVTIILLTCLLALVPGLIAAGWYQRDITLNNLLESVRAQARLMALYSEVPLSFEDRTAAVDILDKAQIEHLMSATLFDSYGNVFASVSDKHDRVSTLPPLEMLVRDNHLITDDKKLLLLEPVKRTDGVLLGHLYLEIALDDLYMRMRDSLLGLTGIGLLLLCFAWLFALRLQRYVSQPLLHLASLSADVSKHDDFSLRAPVASDDEIGTLSRSFNHMLEVIGEREKAREVAVNALQDSNDRLEMAVKELHILANFDALTDLPNRALCMDRISGALLRASREKTQIALIFLDLDHFKEVNDSLGHGVGDQLLKKAAERLQQCIRHEDTLARLGGDEFVLLLEELSDDLNVSAVLNKLMTEFSQAFKIADYVVSTTISMGIAIYPTDGRDVHTLMRNADTAMYKAKELGRNTYQFYQPEMNAKSLRRLSLATELREALQRDQLELYYQPMIDTVYGSVCAVEALLRWKHPIMGSISPVEFIPIAENTGLIVPIGHWVIEQAVKQYAQWQKQGVRAMRVAVNISAVQFRQVDLAEQILRVVNDYGVSPSALELELTESLLMRDVEGATSQLRKLKALGFTLVIDDFGTGYSSLSYLRRFPLDGLKIDRAFIAEVNRNPDDTAITLAILSMARSLRLHVTAEGVETNEQYEFLTRHGCHEVQGFLFSPPVQVQHITPLLLEDSPEFPRLVSSKSSDS